MIKVKNETQEMFARRRRLELLKRKTETMNNRHVVKFTGNAISMSEDGRQSFV